MKLTKWEIEKLYDIIQKWWAIKLDNWLYLFNEYTNSKETLIKQLAQWWIVQVEIKKWSSPIPVDSIKWELKKYTIPKVKPKEIVQPQDTSWISMDSEQQKNPQVKTTQKTYTPKMWDVITLKDWKVINIDTEEKLKVVAEKVKANYKWFKENTESIRNEPIKIPTQDTSWISMDSEIPKDQEFEKFIRNEKVSKERLEEIANKIKTWAKVTKEDLAIQTWYKNEIENLLKWKNEPQINLIEKPLQSTVDNVVDATWDKPPKISMKDIKMSWSFDDVVDTTKKWASSVDDIQPIKQTIWEILWWDKSKIKTFLQQNPKIAGILKWEWGKTLNLLAETSPKTAASLKFWWKTIIPVTVAYNSLKDLEVQNEWKYDWSWNMLSDIASWWKILEQWVADAWVNLAVNLWTDAIKFWDLVWKWIAWTLWQAGDMGKNLIYFWATDENKKQMDENNIDYSDKFTDAWDSLWISNKWDSYANNTKASAKEYIYWNWDNTVYNRTLDKYNKDSWIDREWNALWISMDSEYKQPTVTANATTINQPQSNIVVPKSDTNQWTQQWRRLFKLKDGTFWYLSQWWENEWKLVRWFKTLDEAKNAVNQWV